MDRAKRCRAMEWEVLATVNSSERPEHITCFPSEEEATEILVRLKQAIAHKD